MPSFDNNYSYNTKSTRIESNESQQTKLASMHLLEDPNLGQTTQKPLRGPNDLFENGEIQFSTTGLYGLDNLKKRKPLVPENKLLPFSTDQILNSGKTTADLLSSHTGSGESNYVILSQDNPEGLVQDIAAYKKSGAVGGIQQGGLDDCWFQVSVAALATTAGGAEKISQMISMTADGQYQVTFPGDQLNPIVVSEKEAETNPDISDSGKWDRVLEAAILKRNPKQALAEERGGIGGNIKDGLQLLIGSDVGESYITNADPSTISLVLQNNLKNGKAIVASTNSTTENPIEYRHAYSVIAYDGTTNTITLRNPWGYNEHSPGTKLNGVSVGGAGEISMSLEVFMKNFHKIDYA
jgi:hypothetical protein